MTKEQCVALMTAHMLASPTNTKTSDIKTITAVALLIYKEAEEMCQALAPSEPKQVHDDTCNCETCR